MSLLELTAGAAALAAADRAGLLHRIAREGGRAAALAADLGLDPIATACVLEVLRTQGLVERSEQGYAASATLREGLRGPFGEPDRGWSLFSHAVRFLRDGSAATERMDEVSGREAGYAQVVGYLGTLFSNAAEELAQALATSGEITAILDVGAGSGVWSLAQLEREPRARLTAVDLPGVVTRVHERAAALGVAERVSSLSGSYHELGVPRGAFDRVVFANVLHLERAETAQKLLTRWLDALRPGGQVVIVDNMASDSPEIDRARAAYALFLALRIPGGHPHEEVVLRGWLEDAGCHEVRRIDLANGPRGLSALVARR